MGTVPVYFALAGEIHCKTTRETAVFYLFASALSTAALACPTLAAGDPTKLSFDTAQVIIARDEDETVFSVAINPKGRAQDMALVLPVPVVPAEEDIRTLDPDIFARMDGFTAPRHVSDAGCGGGGGGATDGSGEGEGEGEITEEGAVDVEATYLVGDYEIFILSAEESGALLDWLDSRGFSLAPGSEALLGDYIDSGSYFFAARVAPDAALANGNALAPLQVRYESEVFSIPIRLAAQNSPGVQDMIITALVPLTDGEVGIANYPSFRVPDKCVWDSEWGSFSAFYQQAFVEAWEEQGDAAWAREYSSIGWGASPESSVWLEEDDFAELGLPGFYSDSVYISRLHLRYTPEQADQDLVLYPSGIMESTVLSYADDTERNRSCIDDCVLEAEPPLEEEAEGEVEGGKAGCGCQSGGFAAGLLPLLSALLGGLLRRGKGGGKLSGQ